LGWKGHVVGVESIQRPYYKTYLEDWAYVRPIASGKCPNLAGTYRDTGTGVSFQTRCSGSSQCQLSFHLFKGDAPGTAVSGTHIVISHREELLELRLLSDERLVDERTLSMEKGEFACTGEGLEISQFQRVFTIFGADAIIFRRLEDGSLAGRFKQSGVGAAIAAPMGFPVPFEVYTSDWLKWGQVKNHQGLSL
jgi:hypothetical protein